MRIIRHVSFLYASIDLHDSCAKFLEKTVEDLLLHPADLDKVAQEILLKEIDTLFTEQDNKKFLTIPTKDKVLEVISDSNLLAAPGTDGIPSLLYKIH